MRKSILAVCLLLACGTAAAAFDDWDEDSNDEISQDEFFAGMDEAGLYGEIDRDSDGFIDQGEFEDMGVDSDWDDWDADNDEYVDATEFYEGVFSTFDENDDDVWDQDEWNAARQEDWLAL